MKAIILIAAALAYSSIAIAVPSDDIREIMEKPVSTSDVFLLELSRYISTAVDTDEWIDPTFLGVQMMFVKYSGDKGKLHDLLSQGEMTNGSAQYNHIDDVLLIRAYQQIGVPAHDMEHTLSRAKDAVELMAFTMKHAIIAQAIDKVATLLSLALTDDPPPSLAAHLLSRVRMEYYIKFYEGSWYSTDRTSYNWASAIDPDGKVMTFNDDGILE